MNKFRINPLGERVIIKPIINDEKTSGGIIIPDTAKEKPTEGLVIAVGPGKVTNDGLLIKPNVKINDTVLYGKYGGTELKINGEEFFLMNESDVYGIVNKED